MKNWNAINLGNLNLTPNRFCVIAGPCSIENHEQLKQIGEQVKSEGANLLRGGMFKLRTDPDSFQGLGENAFSIAKRVKSEISMPFVSEVTDPRQIGDMIDVVDVFQVGSRNMHNYALLKELGMVKKPVLLKRGFSGLVKEWLLSADYIIKGGNEQVILCERGIRTFENATRNTFDLNAIAHVKKYHNLPVFADPSHATGDANLVIPMSLAAAAAGADGLMVEVHYSPEKALSDSYQTINFPQFSELMTKLKQILPLLDKELMQNHAQ